MVFTKKERYLMAEKHRFLAKKGSILSHEQATVYGARLFQLLKQKEATVLKPAEVVEDACDPLAPYHKFFIWDNKAAGRRYRLVQARYIMQSIVEVKIMTVAKSKPDEAVEIRVFSNASVNRKRGYGGTAVLLEIPEARTQILGQVLQQLRSLSLKYRYFQELAKVHSAIDEAWDELEITTEPKPEEIEELEAEVI